MRLRYRQRNSPRHARRYPEMGTVLIWGRQIAYSLNRRHHDHRARAHRHFHHPHRQREGEGRRAVMLSSFIQTAVSPLVLKFPERQIRYSNGSNCAHTYKAIHPLIRKAFKMRIWGSSLPGGIHIHPKQALTTLLNKWTNRAVLVNLSQVLFHN